MARRHRWLFRPGEARALGANFTSKLGASDTLTGSPTVAAYTRTGKPGAYTYTAADGFTFDNEQVNASSATDADGEAMAAGKGLLFSVTAPTTQGTYYIRSECASTDGENPVREDVLVVEGAA